MLFKNFEKYVVVYRSEEFSDIAFQDPARSRIVPAHRAEKCLEPAHRLVRPLAEPAGIRIVDEALVEIRIEHAIDRMMKQAVTHACLVNVSRLRVGDVERVVAAVAIRFRFQVRVERQDIVHELQAEFLHISLLPLAPQEFFPCLKKILDRDDIIKSMREPIRATPPPADFACH